jgi:hypothetical protein
MDVSSWGNENTWAYDDYAAGRCSIVSIVIRLLSVGSDDQSNSICRRSRSLALFPAGIFPPRAVLIRNGVVERLEERERESWK